MTGIGGPLRVLILEDSPNDAQLLRELMSDAGFLLTSDWAATEQEFITLLGSREYDVILSDFSLPGYDAFGALTASSKIRPGVPFICVSGSIGEETALDLIRHGAVDYILKDRLVRLPSAIHRALCETEEIKMRRRAEAELHKLNRTHTVLSRINQLIVRERDPYRLFTEACSIAVEQGGLSMCWVTRLDVATGDVTTIAHAGPSTGYHDDMRFTLPAQRTLMGPTGITLSQRTQSVCNDIEREEHMHPWREAALAAGIRSTAAFPLCIGVHCFGAITFNSQEAHFFDDEELHLLDELSRDISFAIESSENDRERKEIEQRHAEQARLLDIAIDAISVRDMNDQLLYWNASAEKLYGWTSDEVKLLDIRNFVEEEDHQKYRQSIVELLRDGAWEGELLERTKAGALIMTYSRWTLVRNQHGEPISRLIITRDISNQKRMEEQARHLSRAVDQSPASVIITDTNGTIEYINKRFTEITGYTPDEVIGRNPRILSSGTLPREVYTRLWSRITSGKEWNGEFHNRKKDGTLFWESASVTPMYNEAGMITHFLAVQEDITERKRTEEALRESEERYRTLIRNQGEGISLCDVHDTFMFANPAAEALFEVPPGTLRGRNYREFIIPEHRSIFQHETEAHGLGERATYELDITALNGARRCLLVTTIKQSDKKGMYTGTFSVFRDITERKQIEEKLRESEEYYRTLVEATPDAIVIIDKTVTVIFASAKAYAVFGIPQGQSMLGHSFLAWVQADEQAVLSRRISGIFSLESEQVVREYQLTRSDTTPFWGEISSSRLVDAEKHITGALLLCRDVTDKKRLQQELVQSQKMQSIGRLAGGIAHDFNNILGIILAYTSLMEKTKMTPEKYADRIAGIDTAVQRGAALVKQILTFARKTDSLFEPFDLVALVRELLSMLKQTFPKTITFHEQIGKNIPFILADRTQIHQALLNLCVNARDAMTRAGTITLSVQTQTREEVQTHFAAASNDSYVCVTVADTGDGMTDAVRAKIFDPFFTTKELGKGTGMGLSVVFGVIQAHQGFIDVESEVGRGTTFRLWLPVPVVEAPAPQAAAQLTSLPVTGTETILLVEDEEYLREMMLMSLETHGYHVVAAEDGMGAVQMYRQHRDEIALVFSDMGLPGMTGTDVYLEIKKINPEVKFLFASGYVSPEAKSELIKAGARGFMQKPYVPNDVLKKMRAVLDKA